MFRPIHIRRYIALMQARGFSAEAVLAGSGLSARMVDDAACLVNLEQCHAVVKNMIRLTGDSGLGFAFGLQSQITDLSIVAHAVMSARSMRQVVALWIQYGNALVGSLLRVSLEEHEDESWTLRVVDSGAHRSIYAFCVEDFMVGGTRYGGQLAGEPFKVRNVQFSYPQPAHVDRYEAFFNCPMSFDAADTLITIGSPGLARATRSDDDAFNDICIRHCHQIMRQIASQSPLISRLRSRFLQESDRLPSMDQSARELGISTRTLRRQLLQEGTNYQALLDRFRHDMAMEYLNTGLMSTKEVAYLLGFGSSSTFCRAFRLWTGQTVGEYLDRQKLPPPAQASGKAFRSK